MFDSDRWQEIWFTITRNKTRSFLTAFGVFWGIFMLVVMSGSGYGLKNGILSGSAGFAQNSAFFFSGRTSESYKGFSKGRYWSMKNEDIEILVANIPEIKYISPMVFGPGNDKNTVRGDKYGTYRLLGFYPDYIAINPQNMIYGRYLNEIDVTERRKVCVIGVNVYKEMFATGENPVGQFLKVDAIYYQIIGVAVPMTDINLGGDPRKMVVFPSSTMQQMYNMGNVIHAVAVTADEQERIGSLEERMTALIKAHHSIAPTDLQAVNSINLEKKFRMFTNLFTGINWLIWVVGTGTLLAGVVGVSNIMLVTVRERTKEIGIRRAIGAKPITILIQIMSEGLVLTSIAGFIGLASGVAVLSGVDHLMSASGNGDVMFKNPQIPFSIAIVSTLVLLACGVLSGLLPAWRALQIKAIDAIREE